jgi:hypothetical protein
MLRFLDPYVHTLSQFKYQFNLLEMIRPNQSVCGRESLARISRFPFLEFVDSRRLYVQDRKELSSSLLLSSSPLGGKGLERAYELACPGIGAIPSCCNMPNWS